MSIDVDIRESDILHKDAVLLDTLPIGHRRSESLWLPDGHDRIGDCCCSFQNASIINKGFSLNKVRYNSNGQQAKRIIL